VLRTLPDLLRPGLDLVFVGMNPSEYSARARHYYAHPGNAFWPALSASPLVERSLAPEDDRALPASHGIGFTDVVKRVVTDSAQVATAELHAAAPGLRGRVAYAGPRAICFTNTRAFAALFPGAWQPRAWGRQPVTFEAPIEKVEVWVMPSTSGRAAGYHEHVHRVLGELAAALGRAADARGAAA
jgi:TDG/mug DNA glycosylase family protein